MNLQQAFDQGTKGVIAQGCKSMDIGRTKSCLYLNPNGAKCFVGHLLPEDIELTGRQNRMSVGMLAGETELLSHLEVTPLQLEQLQRMHDQAEGTEGEMFVESFKAQARDFARRHHLHIWFDQESPLEEIPI